jgi:NitT/TauT family transport system substrate-binding protein
VAPLYLAADAGYFAEEGLDVSFKRVDVSSPAALAALVHGDIDVTLAGPKASFINAIARGSRVRVVAGEGYLSPDACPQFAWVVPRSWLRPDGSIDTARLRGARTRYDPMALATFELARALATAGLTLDDVKKAPVPTELVSGAVLHGDIDLAYLPTLQLNKALATGKVVTWKKVADVVPDAQIYSLVFTERLLRADREAGIRFLVAYLRAVREIRRGWTPKTAEILARRFEVSPEEIRAECWPSFRPDGRVEERCWTEYQEWVQAQGGLDRVLKPGEYIDASLLAEANRRLQARGQ